MGRWHRDCGCNSGGRPRWHQRWRQPLRDEVAPAYEVKAQEFFRDPSAARDEYISVVLDRSDKSVARFFEQQAKRKLSEEDQATCLRLVELQRNAGTRRHKRG